MIISCKYFLCLYENRRSFSDMKLRPLRFSYICIEAVPLQHTLQLPSSCSTYNKTEPQKPEIGIRYRPWQGLIVLMDWSVNWFFTCFVLWCSIPVVPQLTVPEHFTWFVEVSPSVGRHPKQTDAAPAVARWTLLHPLSFSFHSGPAYTSDKLSSVCWMCELISWSWKILSFLDYYLLY